MKRFIKFFPLLLVIIMCASISHAQTVRSTFGNKDSSGDYTMTERTDNIIYMRPSGGVKFAYENKTTSDTLTLVECGKSISYSGTINSVITLPTADVGCWFKFTSTTNASLLAINPSGTERIMWSSGVTELSAGDSLINSGATQDSLELLCTVDQEWAVFGINGTWADNN